MGTRNCPELVRELACEADISICIKAWLAVPSINTYGIHVLSTYYTAIELPVLIVA